VRGGEWWREGGRKEGGEDGGVGIALLEREEGKKRRKVGNGRKGRRVSMAQCRLFSDEIRGREIAEELGEVEGGEGNVERRKAHEGR
jgi:hypothetical protein